VTGPKNVCRNCKWAEWQMTAHKNPRPNPSKFGRCKYPLSRVAMPFMVRMGDSGEHPSSAIWWNQVHPCRVWEPKP
jgi:hypothetical protein